MIFQQARRLRIAAGGAVESGERFRALRILGTRVARLRPGHGLAVLALPAQQVRQLLLRLRAVGVTLGHRPGLRFGFRKVAGTDQGPHPQQHHVVRRADLRRLPVDQRDRFGRRVRQQRLPFLQDQRRAGLLGRFRLFLRGEAFGKRIEQHHGLRGLSRPEQQRRVLPPHRGIVGKRGVELRRHRPRILHFTRARQRLRTLEEELPRRRRVVGDDLENFQPRRPGRFDDRRFFPDHAAQAEPGILFIDQAVRRRPALQRRQGLSCLLRRRVDPEPYRKDVRLYDRRDAKQCCDDPSSHCCSSFAMLS